MQERIERGRDILRKTLGDEYYERRIESTNDFNRELRELTDEYCFGAVWGREALPQKTRSMLVVALLASMGRTSELKTHIGGAINNGCSVDEIKDTLLQVAVYCGIPAGVEGIRTAEQVLRDRKLID